MRPVSSALIEFEGRLQTNRIRNAKTVVTQYKRHRVRPRLLRFQHKITIIPGGFFRLGWFAFFFFFSFSFFFLFNFRYFHGHPAPVMRSWANSTRLQRRITIVSAVVFETATAAKPFNKQAYRYRVSSQFSKRSDCYCHRPPIIAVLYLFISINYSLCLVTSRRNKSGHRFYSLPPGLLPVVATQSILSNFVGPLMFSPCTRTAELSVPSGSLSHVLWVTFLLSAFFLLHRGYSLRYRKHWSTGFSMKFLLGFCSLCTVLFSVRTLTLVLFEPCI